MVSDDQPVLTTSAAHMLSSRRRRISPILSSAQLTLLVEGYLARGRTTSPGDQNENQELVSAEVLVRVIELVETRLGVFGMSADITRY